MYSLPVKIESLERRKRNSRLLHLLCGFFTLLNAAALVTLKGWPIALPFFLVAAISLAYGFISRKKDPAGRYNLGIRALQLFCFTAMIFIFWPQSSGGQKFSLVLWTLVLAVVTLMERALYRSPGMVIREQGIFVPGFFAEQLIPWSLVSDLVIRTDYVTITRTDKKFVQLELTGTVHDADAITRFSQQQIERSASKIVAE